MSEIIVDSIFDIVIAVTLGIKSLCMLCPTVSLIIIVLMIIMAFAKRD